MTDSEARSVLAALVASVRALDVDPEDIDGTLHYAVAGVPTLIIYDTVPGGAGHARRIAAGLDDLVVAALARAETEAATIPVLRIGRKIFRDVAVALAPHTDPREDGLLPVTAFESVYIAGDRENVVIR